MQYVAILGYPLRHTLSPFFQQAAFDHLGLAVQYRAWETEPGSLDQALSRLREPSCLGANLTIPHKEASLPLLDEVDDLARRIGAVNTVVNHKGSLHGYNTDPPGFLASLRGEGGFEPRGKRAVLLGAGGAARAVAFALLQEGVSSLKIFNRTPERAVRLISDLAQGGPARAHLEARGWNPTLIQRALAGSDLLVHCTPLGMAHSEGAQEAPLSRHALFRRLLVCDLVYNPPQTPLLREAQKAGARTLGGLPMLIYQGAASFELWTGQKAPLEVMFAAANTALLRL